MTTEEFKIPFSGLDPCGRLKHSVLLEMFQDIADVDATKYNISVPQTIDYGCTWILRNYKICLEKYPCQESGSIKIKSFAQLYRRLYSLRFFKVYDANEEYLGMAYTWWALIDFVKKRPVRLDTFEPFTAFCELTDEFVPDMSKIEDLDTPDITEVWKARWQQLDVNNHTNHTVYFSWALDTVPAEVPERMVPIHTEAEYIKPIPCTKVRCLTKEVSCGEGRKFIHSIRHIDSDEEYARLCSVWVADGRKILELPE